MSYQQQIREAEALCGIAGFVLSTTEGTPAGQDDWKANAAGLVGKCFFHAQTCLHLSHGTRIRDTNQGVLDLNSINVLVRSALESALIFHHVFAGPDTDEEREYRHLCWKLEDLVMLQAFDPVTEESRAKKASAAKEAAQIGERLRATARFQQLKPGEQSDVLNKGRWKPGWTTLARNAGLNDAHAVAVHKLLCSHAHSGWLSVQQFLEPKTKPDQGELLKAAIGLVNIGLALIVTAYCSVFQVAGEALARHPDRGLVEMWMFVGCSKDADEGGNPECQ